MAEQSGTSKNRINVEERLMAFALGAGEQQLLAAIWREVEPRLDWVVQPMRERLESQMRDKILPPDFPLEETLNAMRVCMTTHYGEPIDEDWMKTAAGVGNWITANGTDPYWVIALMHLSFTRVQALACENARDADDRAERLRVLGAVNHLGAELAVARVNRIARYQEADRRNAIAEQFRTTIAELVSATTRRSVAMSKLAGRAKDSTKALVIDAADIASAAEQSAQVMSNAARESAQLVESIDTTRRSVGEVSRVTTDTAREADAAGEVISALNQHTTEITSVVAMIRNVADLTRMLALNATIEAAHAGEAGKGFAVVAQEVKALAAQTETATDEIVRQISAIQASGGRTVEANIAIAQSIGEVARSATSFQQAMESQSSQVTTIASMIDETAMTARAMADTVASIRTSAEEVDEQANNVELAFGDVSDRLAELETAVSHFLRDIAA
ncbi:MAG: methyl-accepting chemotaxis protein [Erythrobacter sp.]